MEIPIDAEVRTADGRYGRSTYIILNPATDTVTHVVVKRDEPPHSEFVVPIELITESTPHYIQLRSTNEELEAMDTFSELEFIRVDIPHQVVGSTMLQPYAVPQQEVVTEEHERIPPGELAVRRGTRVDASDGHIGHVNEFLVDPLNGHITHLILREGHLWGKRDVTIPVGQIERIAEGTVHLKLNKREVDALSAIPVRRFWD